MTQTWIGKHWMTGKPIRVEVKDGNISSIQETQHSTDRWIAPGLIDVQVNGIGGFDLNGLDTTVQTIQDAVRVLHKGGVTKFCPTVVTGTRANMLRKIEVLAEAYEKDQLVRDTMIGIHVEGPFTSPEDGPRGAHNKEWIRDPDWDEFLEWHRAAPNLICKVTLAPERPGAIDFIRKLCELDIVAAIGHTNASDEDIRQAVEAGATMSTHLGNGAHPYIKRHPNYIWAQLAEDKLWAGLIPDGFHLPPNTLKVMIRTKGRKAILTSDNVHLAGMPPGRYHTHINDDVILEPSGLLHPAHTKDILAGSAIPLHAGLQNVAKFGICSLGEAINMATLHPAELFGLDSSGAGKLEVNAPADFILYNWTEDEEFHIVNTVLNGHVVHNVESS